MSTDNVEPLLPIIEEAIRIDPDQRARIRQATLQAYADERAAAGSLGSAEVVRLAVEAGGGPAERRRRPRSTQWLTVAAAITVVVAAAVVLSWRSGVQAPSSPVDTSLPVTTSPQAPPAPPVPSGGVAPSGRYSGSDVGLPLEFDTRSALFVTHASDGAVVFELPEASSLGRVVIALDPDFVGASDVEAWLDVRSATAQRSMVQTLGEVVPVIDILGSPGDVACESSTCPLFSVASGSVELDTQVGTLTQVIVTSIEGRPLVIAAVDATPDLTLHAEALWIARSMVRSGTSDG